MERISRGRWREWGGEVEGHISPNYCIIGPLLCMGRPGKSRPQKFRLRKGVPVKNKGVVMWITWMFL